MKSAACSLLVLATLSGCLSIDIIPVAEPDPKPTRDAGMRDGAVGDADSEDADTEDAEPGDAETPDAAIDAGGPPGIPACSPGVNSACVVEVKAHPVLAGNFVYWIESGTTDSFNNYRYDGALLRMRIGEWRKEVVLSGLDFYDDAQRQIFGVNLVASEGYVVWSSALFSGYVEVSEAAQTVRPLGWTSQYGSCRIFDETALCDGSYNYTNVTYGRRLDRDEPMALVMQGYGNPFLRDGALYGQGQVDSVRIDTATNEQQTFQAAAILVDTLPDGRLVGLLADRRIGLAPFNGGTTPRWMGIAGPETYIGVQGSWLYWMSPEEWTGDSAGPHYTLDVYRTRLDGSQQQLVVGRAVDFDENETAVGTGGLLIGRLNAQGSHYIPLPPD